jgi:site-specific recombinase XerD
MHEFESFLAPVMESFIAFRKASGRWNDFDAQNLRYFNRHCAEMFPGAMELTQEMVDVWCRRRDTELSNTCRGRIYVIHHFICYLKERGLTEINEPPIPTKAPRIYIPHAFTEEELVNFFKACDNLPTTPRRRDILSRRIIVPVFFRLLLSSGIRTTEARLLRVDDVKLDDGILNIRHSKGSSQHFVVLHDSMLSLMRRYDNAIRMLYPEREYFFQSFRGSCLTNQWVVVNFRQLWRKYNTSHAVAYELRHNYAIENINQWVGEGFNFYDKLLYLSRSMGHSELESTKYYYSLVPALSGILSRLTGENFNNTIPDLNWDKRNIYDTDMEDGGHEKI